MALKVYGAESTVRTTTAQQVNRPFAMIDNYIYLYHTNTFLIIPTYPDTVTDSMSVSFATTTPLSCSAPIYSFQNSGPRSVQFSLRLHREIMSQVNWQKSNAQVALNDDYIDTLIKGLQSAALPKYSSTSKMVDPPIIAVRFGSDIFCKGIVQGGVSVTYELPIITDKAGNDKYSIANISFTVHEIDPYDAETVMLAGSYRGLDTTLERNLWKG